MLKRTSHAKFYKYNATPAPRTAARVPYNNIILINKWNETSIQYNQFKLNYYNIVIISIVVCKNIYYINFTKLQTQDSVDNKILIKIMGTIMSILLSISNVH